MRGRRAQPPTPPPEGGGPSATAAAEGSEAGLRCLMCGREIEKVLPPPALNSMTLADLGFVAKQSLAYAAASLLIWGMLFAVFFAGWLGGEAVLDGAFGEGWWADVPGWIKAAIGLALGIVFVISGRAGELLASIGTSLVEWGRRLNRGHVGRRFMYVSVFVGVIVGFVWYWWATLFVLFVILAPIGLAIDKWRRKVQEDSG